MYQRPGVLIGLSSCQSAPLYQRGSFGVRLIISPPLPTGIGSAMGPFMPSSFFRMSCTGRIQYPVFHQSTGGGLAARSHDFDNRIRSSWERSDGKVGRCGFWLV